jgi:hypothetical protein
MTNGQKLIAYMKAHNYRIWALNIVYLIGVDPDSWAKQPNIMDRWNDARIVVRDSGEVLLSNTATTDAGAYWENNPMNSGGCAIVALGNHKNGWSLGEHRGRPALVQCGPLLIYRDREANGIRRGTPRLEDNCGINQHGCNGTDGSDKVGRWSAGCLVGRYWSSHLKFVEVMKNSGRKTFDTTLIDASDFQDFCLPTAPLNLQRT